MIAEPPQQRQDAVLLIAAPRQCNLPVARAEPICSCAIIMAVPHTPMRATMSYVQQAYRGAAATPLAEFARGSALPLPWCGGADLRPVTRRVPVCVAYANIHRIYLPMSQPTIQGDSGGGRYRRP